MGMGSLRRRLPWNLVAGAKNLKVLNDIIIKHLTSGRALQGGTGPKVTALNLLPARRDQLGIPHATEGSSSWPLSLDHPSDVEVLTSNIKALLFAGHDTTSSTICFLFKCLQDNPDSLAKMRTEHDLIIGTDPAKAGEVIKSAPHLLYELPYTLGVIKETLRLYPIASTIRQGISGFSLTLPGSTVQYPMEGFAPWIAIHAIHQSPDLWQRPLEFLPQRWTVPQGHELFPPKDAWMPFSIGK